jgi:hypothetical protein
MLGRRIMGEGVLLLTRNPKKDFCLRLPLGVERPLFIPEKVRIGLPGGVAGLEL